MASSEQAQMEADPQDQVINESVEADTKSMELNGVAVIDQLTNIYEILDREETKEVVLYGKSGVGKTWMARKVAARALRQGKFDIALWIYPNRDLQESIAYQLAIPSASDDSEAKEDKEELKQDKAKQEKHEEVKEKKKKEKLEGMIHAALKGKRLLLVLDDVEVALSEGPNLYKVLPLDQLNYKVLITCRHQPSPKETGIMVRPLTQDEARALVLRKMVGVSSLDEIKDLADYFIGKSGRLPAEVLIVAKTMSWFRQSETGLQKLRSVKEILEKEKSDNKKSGNVVQLLISGYEVLPRSVLIDCYSSETPYEHFLGQHDMVNYNELISYWILEGHLGNFDCIEDAYEEGHRVLMDLVDCGLLKELEAGYVVSSGAKFEPDIHDCYKFFESINLGLATTFDNKLGSIALADGMMKTVSSGQEGKKKLSTLLLDGNRFGEVPDMESASELENLVIFNPTHKPFPLPVFKMQKLRLLVLRGCEFLEHFEDIFQWKKPENPEAPEKSQPNNPSLQHSQSLPPPQISDPLGHSPGFVAPNILLWKLTVLEISGPSSLKTIPDNLFKNMPDLRNLNMSFLQIESLPSSFYMLTKLEFLILRGCSSLQELGSLKNFKDLQVLDLSGATSVANLQDKSFSENKKLQILNLSKTSIEKLPLVHSLKNLKSLSLRDCPILLRIRKINALKFLQVFDISGSTKVEEFLDPSLEDLKSLELLDASRTSVRRLPSNIGNPRYLYLRGCSQLKELPPIEALNNVEVLDLSGSCHLEEVKFFENMKCLVELNLSNTSIKHLPSLSSFVNLRRLLLSQCLSLEKLKDLSSLEELEVLDLSGCKALKEIEDKSFDKMNHLHSLDLSEIQLDRLPSLSQLKKLKKLYVRDCPKLTNLPGLEELPALEILDHSGTALKPPPSFNSPDCHPVILSSTSVSLENFNPQQLLKDLGSNVKVPSDNFESHHLQQEDLNQCNWSISSWQCEGNVSEERIGVPVNGIHFLQLLKMCPSLLTKNFSQFHFCVYPTEAQTKPPDKASYIDELSLRDIYLEQVSPRKPERCLEIRGFKNCPPCLGHLLEQAEFVVLIDNPFLKFLPDLGVDSIKSMKGCWIERCNQMEHIIASEEVEDNQGKNFADNLENLEILWVSDVIKLRSLMRGDVQGVSFKSLTGLYLEYCPQLRVLCPSSLQLDNLEILCIRYCQKLEALFEDDSAKLEKLTALHLWGLPELKKIVCKLQSLRTLRVGQCPMLEHVISSSQGHEKLEVLHIKFCDKLRAIFESQHEERLPRLPVLQELELWALPELQKVACEEAPSLHTLRVGECHSLENVVDSFGLCEELKTLEVKSCEKLKTVIQGNGLVLQELQKMELLCLPEVESIGADHLPSLQEENCIIWGCPKLQEQPLSREEHMDAS